jgi:hypothetical protein
MIPVYSESYSNRTALAVCEVLLASVIFLCGDSTITAVLRQAGSGAPQSPETKQSQQKPKPSPQGDSNKKAASPRIVVPSGGWDLASPAELADEAAVVAAARGGNEPQALAPLRGKMYGRNPAFAWSCECDNDEFVFVLRDDQFAEIMRKPVTGKQYRPAALPRLDPGKIYSWEIEVAGQPVSSTPVKFQAVSADEGAGIGQALAEAADSDPYQSALAAAGVLAEHRLWYDAIGAFTDLIAHYPNRVELYELRGAIYDQVAATRPLAVEDRAKAKELRAAAGL